MSYDVNVLLIHLFWKPSNKTDDFTMEMHLSILNLPHVILITEECMPVIYHPPTHNIMTERNYGGSPQ